MNREIKRQRLRKEIAEFKVEINERELKIMDLEDEELFEEYSEEFEIETSTETSRHSTKRKEHIWELKNFKKYSLPRKYNEKTQSWKTHENTQGRDLYLPFNDLISVIIMYQQGASSGEIFRKVPNRLRSSSGIKTWIYMYRAGAFNDEIKRLAPKYGYNSDALVSKECEGLDSNINGTQDVLI